MAEKRIPKKLAKQPVIDVVFEVRFTTTQPASSILPGAIFTTLANRGLGKIESLPQSQIPAEFRAQDENLKYSPIIRIHWEGKIIAIGDYTLALACTAPYPGWSALKDGITLIFDVLKKTGMAASIERCSLKYIDLFENISNHDDALRQLDITLNIGKPTDERKLSTVRTEIWRAPYIHAIQWVSLANVVTPNTSPRVGAILEIDSILSPVPGTPGEFFDQLSSIADNLHTANKELFFELLSDEGLARLEPIYD